MQPNGGPAGSSITVSGTGFLGHEKVKLGIGGLSPPLAFPTKTTTNDGSFSIVIDIPAWVPSGNQWFITATGADGDSAFTVFDVTSSSIFTSNNWAGLLAQGGAPYDGAQAQFTIPDLARPAPPNTVVAIWGGRRRVHDCGHGWECSCSERRGRLCAQAAEAVCSCLWGKAHTHTHTQKQIALTKYNWVIHTGDVMSIVTAVAGNTVRFSFTDLNRGWTHIKPFPILTSEIPQQSGECVVEDPGAGGGVLFPFSDFSDVKFSSCSVTQQRMGKDVLCSLPRTKGCAYGTTLVPEDIDTGFLYAFTYWPGSNGSAFAVER